MNQRTLAIFALSVCTVCALMGAIKMARAQQKTKRHRVTKVMLYSLTGTAIKSKQIDMISNNLLAEIRKLQGISAIGMDEVLAMLTAEEQQQMKKCKDNSCITTIAGAIGAEYLVMGDLGAVGKSSVINLKRINMETAEVVSSVNKRMQGGTGEEFLEMIGPVVAELFPDNQLRPGMTRGVPASKVARWNPPPIKPWMTYSAIGAAGATFLSSMVALIVRQVNKKRYSDLLDASQSEAISGKKLVEYELSFNKSHNVFAGFGIASLVIAPTAAILFFFTDWKGAKVSITPAAGPTQAGIVLQGRF